MPHFDYQRVHSLEDAFKLVSASKAASVFLAGGTDLLVQIREGTIRPQRIIDVKGIPEMDGVDIAQHECSIGAATRIRTLEISKGVHERLPILAQAASKLGSIQVRNQATIGGNLCNAAPSAETAPALLVLDAQAEIFGKAGKRTIDLIDFFRGPGITVLEEGEILTRLKVPLSGNRQGSVYYKLTTRKAMDLAFVGVAVLLELDGDNKIIKARIALGAVAPTPIRVPAAEKRLEGRSLSVEIALEAAGLAAQACQPISDHRASAEYRREMVHTLCQRGLLAAYGQAIDSKEGERV